MNDKVLPEFDENGNLPLGCYKPTFEEFEERFVKNFTKKKHRNKLLIKYQQYCKRFSTILMITWIDGSYTTKKTRPNDIDITVHYDALKFNDIRAIPNSEKMDFIDKNRMRVLYKCHTQYVPVYPKDNPNYLISCCSKKTLV